MGETDGDIEPRASAEPDAPAAQDTLQVPTQKKRKLKSPTPGSLRGRSSTPIHGRSQTPFTLYMTRRSATPSTWRSITPFLNREEKEKTPFELGRDIKSQTTCNIAVFDRALVMDISEPLDVQKPVRYITSDLSVIDRAAVMDVSNVEVIYVVEEYEEFDEEEILEEVKPKKKEKKARKPRVARKSVDMTSDSEDIVDGLDDREDSLDLDDDEPVKKGKKKAPPKKKEKKEKSPSPKLSLKLEIGGGQKASKKMFEQQQQAGPKPPPKKSKMVLQMEEQAKAAAKAAEEEANRAKPKGETFEERQKRLQAEKEEQEEQERLEAEQRALEEAEEEEEPPEEGEDGTEAGYGDEENEYPDENAEENPEDLAEEEEDVVVDLKKEKRRGSDSSDDFVRPDPHEEERWQRIAAIEGEEFMQQMRKYSMAKRISEKERDADWQNRREQGRRPKFINFLSDRTVECGQSVRLACAVDGPELSAKWFKDRRQLERDGCHRISNNNNILVLEVLNTNILDSGEYSCVISNQNDEVTSSCIVTVYEVFKDEPKPPTIQYIKEYYHLRDDELTIECHVHGVPRPVITWWRGAFQVKPSYKFTMLEEAHGVCKLLIYKPGNKDGGIYTLKAINSIGEVQINHTVEVAKNLHYHVPGIFHARDRIQLDSLKHAKRQMDAALKSMAESDQRRAEAEAEQARLRPVRPSPEPLVPAKQKLSFATQLRDRMALEGSTIKFVATVIGPSPSTRWMKDDKWVVVGGNIKNLSEEGKAILAIENATTADSGVYKCVAKNELSEIETSCYFKVYAAQTDGDESEPIFALPLRDVYHASQNDLIIDTKVRGNPRPVITWTKDQIPVVLDDRVVQIEHLDGICELIINKPTVNDNGIYVCSAQNKLGSQSTTHTVVVDTHSSRRSSILSTLAMQDGAKEGEAAEGGGKAKSRPKKKKDDEEEAGGGGGGDGGYERRSRMPDPSPKQMLYFTVNLSNRYVAEGSKVKLQAVIGGPEPTLKWQKDDQNVSYGPRIRNMNRDGLAVLEFVNASTEDSGTYTITAQNEHCKITTSAVLHVYEAKVNTDVQPVFIRSLKDTYHLNTNELILETAVRGQPTPEVQWFKDSIEIQSGGRFQLIEHQDGSCELHIDRPDNKDSGKYVVKAESRAGKMEISHYVLFEGMAHHIADNIHGVFHADKNLLRAKEEKEKPSEDWRKPTPAAAAPEAESEAEAEEGKGKRRGRKADDDEGVSSAYASDYASDSGSISSKRREKNIVIHFSTSMRDRVVAEGSKVKISCFLDAKEPQVKWFKDGEQLVNGPKIRGRYSEGLCLLEITSATAEDNGEYKCWGRDETGEASTSCRLEVFEDPGTGDVPPTFTRNIKDTLHGKINELQLDVHVRGLPTPSVTWVKDGVKIENSDKYQQVDHDDGTCELFISSPKPSDSGKYVCQAENREGKTEIVHMVTVEKRVRAPRISPPREGRPPRPAGEGEELAAGEEGEVGADGEPRRRKPKPDEEEVTSSRREVPMPPDLRKRLYFRNYLSNRTVKSGSNVKWMVNIDGPEPSAKWFHGDQPIAFGPKSKMSMQDGIAWLNLVGVTEEDAGEYTLRVRGSDNEIVSTCNLFVYSTGKEEIIPPTFVVGIKDTYSLNENELVLDCRVRGQPRPDITWMKGNEILSSDEKYQITDQADGYAKLVIVNPTEKDSGVYSCVARNEGAENKMSHQVDFKGRERYTQEKTSGFYHRDPNKPHFLTPLGNQTVCDGGTVAISAEFMQTTTPLEVKWLRDRQVVEGPNVQALADRGVYTLTIMKATSEVEGTYTCRASNAYGRIESHANVDVAVGAEKDERPPLFLSRPDTEMKIAVGDPFSFAFRIAGEPKPKLTFMKGTKDITQSDRVSKEVSDDYTRFTVQQAQISDSGTYFVVARNNFGTDRIFVTVTVNPRARSATPTQPRWGLPLDSYSDTSYFRDPPGCISTEPLVVDSGPTHISLSWGKPVSANSAPVIAYKVEAWILGHEGGAYWRELGLTPINSFDAFNLKPNVEYHFRVTPKNRYGWGPAVQTSSALQVGGVECLPEFVKILPGQVKALFGSSFTLQCNMRGAPRPTVTWYKDGIQLSSSSERVRIRQIGSTCALTIATVSDLDSGRYTCEATNSKGRVSTFARLQVLSDSRLYEADSRLKEIAHGRNVAEVGDSLPIFTMRLRDRRVQVTYPVRLTCQIVGYPVPEILWYKDEELINADRRHLITDDGQFFTLEIAATTLDMSGIYTCLAKNELGSVSCHCNLVVDKGIRAYISPDFYVPLDPFYVFPEGSEIRLSTKVEAYPAVGVTWHRNGMRLRPSRRLTATLDSNGYVELIIAEATVRDAGIYVCVASNVVGKVETICRVAIEEEEHKMVPQRSLEIPSIKTDDLPYSKEPLFVVKPRSSEAYEGDNVIIFCEVVGDPKPEVVWLRDFLNPEYYKDAPHFRRIGEGPEYRLEIPSAKLDFTGTYSVIASNCHGEAKAVISLQIFAKDILKDSRMDKVHTRHGNIETLPRFVRNLRNLRCCDGDAISLECHVEAMPEPYIIWEKDGHVVPSDRDYVMSYDGTKAILSIPRVYPEDEGEYTCVAKNSVGRTLSSACIIVDVPEEKENMLSRQLTRPSGLLSAHSTPRSTPRSTPNRSFSPMRRLSYRTSSIDLSGVAERRRSDARNAFTAPKFLAIPYNRVVEEGDNVRFQCAIGGHPTPWATWDKDGLIVTPTTRIAVKEVDDLRFIEIDEVSFDDAGLYRITLENDFGRIEATARLDVIRSSRYSKSPSVRSVRASSSRRNAYLHRRIMGPSTAIGGRMALASGYRGSSVPSVRFYHNNVELEPTDRVHILLQPEDSMAMLIVDNVTREDEGVYTCIISGDHDPLISSTSVTFHEPNTEQQRRRAVIAEPLAEITKAVEGEAIDLCCLIDCDQPYSYLWLRNGEILPDSDEFNYIDHGNGCLCLRLNEPFDIDSGTYSCQVFTSSSSPESNDILLQNSNPASASAPDSDCDCSSSGELCVLERDLSQNDEECIQLLKTPLPVVCGAGEQALFYARVFPCKAEAVWYLNGKPLADEADDSLNMTLESYPENGIRVLRLRDVQPSKSGEIRLQVKHPQTERRIPTARTYTSLLVLPLVRGNSSSSNGSSSLAARSCILTRPEDCTALIGGHVRLSVRYDPFPGTKVIWYKACRAIVEGSNVTIRTSAQQSTLYITDISADDSGKYTVEIMNDYGVEAAAASVAVEGPPEPPSGQPSVSPGPDRMAVAWCGPPYDGGCMITGFIIEMQSCDPVNCDKEYDEWQQVARVVDTLAYTVKNLQPQMQYRFRVRAENIHGRSAPSQASELVQMSSSQYGARAGETTTVDYGQAVSVQSGGDFKARFEVIEELGKGRFGIVYKVQERDQPQQLLAAKVIKCIKSRDRQKVLEEISIMRSLQHPKLLQLAASFESPREIVMVMEYITGGELFERVVADDFTLTELDCILFLRQVCEGVAYMHSQSVVHLDLKPENIMCHTRTSHQIKIIDFGLAQRLDTKAPVRVLFGTPEFIPPEIISYEPIDFKSDMWSVGVICYVLLSGLSPFMGDTDVETFSNITRADYDYDDEAFDCVSQEAKDFISQLLVHRKEERLTAKQCLESKWLCQRHDDNLSNNKICTDKLKKFIIRRKWQKTGNAIRALGRMATLSASRRNSAIAMGALNSPRPSISGLGMLNAASALVSTVNTQMTSLHEEEDDFSVEMPHVDKRYAHGALKLRDKSQCSERSDSGYSECSNCSLGAAGVVAQETLLLSLAKSKLEQIAKASSGPLPVVLDCPESPITLELPPKGEAIMRSDFTNTIKMRKKSLEDSAMREKPKLHAKPLCESSKLKVSQLKDKFQQTKIASAAANKPKLALEPNKITKVASVGRIPRTEETGKAGSSNSSSTKAKSAQTRSMPSSPLPQRAATPTRLMSQRVREATERLSQQHTVASAQRHNSNGNGNGITNGNSNSNGNGNGNVPESSRESRARSLINRFNETKHITS
ncbi:muscle M-line assembly protein unc-89 isoform X13 [Drosophila pseudoobscura]|uniref:Muscle M-line assembly protein unc-89 isoform X13 n=1 Tax=Drosophila pseudoobscura pseudoobscura TaxID=46245 RepID=A0A6I8V531_DROPS|nr:muscle M-line assembly protein unc-89 isoform X13 [Drosophila pseudoobscura]